MESLQVFVSWFDYTTPLLDWQLQTGQLAKELAKFQQEDSAEQVKKVGEAFNEMFDLGMFMQDNDLDVIFTDLEDSDA